MQSKAVQQYYEYMKTQVCNKSQATFDRYDVFLLIENLFSVKKAMYPGSYVHITPSFVIPEVIYVDNDKKAKIFFSDLSDITAFIEEKKIYNEKPVIRFEAKDYWKDLSIQEAYVDLLISQYAGFVSQACKKYLKKGGVLLANDSHGDATLANHDKDFKFMGVLELRKGKYVFSDESLGNYFKFKRDRPVDIEKVVNTMKGPKYKNTADYYIFMKK
tara:strand:+ start:605 stop:1252 length:648 start_codon:yes stop_codon:yes gene_type:complete